MIIAAADGSALGNPGPAGWAWYVDEECWAAGGWKRATNNQGELKAVLELFRATAHLDDELLVQCDSQYVINCITKWMAGWKRKGWRRADGKPVLNRDLLEELDEAIAGRRYRFEWVRGHAGHPANEAADLRARAVATAYQQGLAIPAGPGWTGGCEEAPASPEASVSPEAAVSLAAPSPVAAAADDRADDATLFDFDDPAADWLTMTLELTTEEHTRLLERAREAGRSPEEFLRGLI
ncbi:ribonuclease HI [Agromyces sp. CFH 90414]|uniref:Ribonuclease H n=1 Tax=Agromyces agglutinans TaxID=2662258 RepID=A0A6I2FDX3_9MICO|nr:RNase H family protein [Agromyces agglutinans]MRG60890.1 ribonuclease HI [Agromyces agglutinans]